MKHKIAILASFIFLSYSTTTLAFPHHALAQTTSPFICNITPENGETGEYSPDQLSAIAHQITIKVIGDQNGGSGTIIAKQKNGNSYLVVTNAHVLLGVDPQNIQIKTADQKAYKANLLPQNNFGKLDLAVLQFTSNQNYCLPPQISTSDITPGLEVSVAGYSSTTGEIVVKNGKVQKYVQPSFAKGYQIGYNTDIEQGMSGGPIINKTGYLLGINGRGAYPILNSGYVDDDGKVPTDTEIPELRKLSWGIPITAFLKQVQPEIISLYNLPLQETEEIFPALKLTGWLGELEAKAKQITVRINSNSQANGSGVIIAQAGDTYTVLTAAHVICERKDATEKCGDWNYTILAPDGKIYPVQQSSIKSSPGIDLAVIKFTSQERYQIATLADYNTEDDQFIFTAGYPKLGNESPWRFTIGQTRSKQIATLDIQSHAQNNNSRSLQYSNILTRGYGLLYTNITLGGMSGGPVLDAEGRVIGIHGLAEAEEVLDQKTPEASNVKDKIIIGRSFGVPISNFVSIAKELNTEVQKVENTPSSKLSQEKVASIEKALLSVDVSKGNATASQWLERGNQLWRLNRNQEAVLAFDQAIKLKPKFIYLAYYGKGLALIPVNNLGEAAKAFEQALLKKPDFVPALQQQSFEYLYLNQLDKALKSANEGIKISPKNLSFLIVKANALMRLSSYKEAELEINEVINLAPIGISYSLRGEFYYYQGKLELAIEDFSKAISLDTQDLGVYYNRGLVYYHQGKLELAIKDLSKVISLNPKDTDAYVSRGGAYIKQGKLELAIKDLSKAISLNPKYTLAYYDRGGVYEDQGKLELATKDLSKAISLNPKYADAYYNRGNIYVKQGKLELGIKDFSKAISLDPKFAGAYYNRGGVYEDQGKLELATKDLSKAISLNPKYADAYYNRGNIYVKQGKLELGIKDFSKAISLDPKYTLAYNNRGNIYQDQGKLELAIEDFSKAISLDPKFAGAYYNRGGVYRDQRKLELAIEDFSKAISLDPKFAFAYANRGFLYYLSGNKQQAIKDLETAKNLFQEQGNTQDYQKAQEVRELFNKL